MRILHHFPLCAYSRAVRILLVEKKLDFLPKYEQPWSLSEDLVALHPFCDLPTLIDINGICVGGSSAIREYIEEMYPDPKLVGQDPEERSEARRIADFFCSSFHNDAYSDTMKERVLKRFYKGTENKTPDTGKVRASLSKLNAYLGYVSWLVDRRNWLAGQSFSVADIYAASFVSVLDYIGCINWEKHQIVKGWYARIKSRPSFRGVLKDNLSQVPPAKDYSNLDF